MSWARAPLLHFALLGGALFALRSGLSGASAAPLEVRVTAAQIEQIEATGRAELGRALTPEEREARVRAHVDDALLVAEARRRGWHRSDPVVQQRLVQNVRFLEAAPEREADAALARAQALGLDERDLVVQRRLAERMRLAIASSVPAEPPDERVLAEILQREGERFWRPARVSLAHVVLTRDRHAEQLEARAQALCEALAREALPPERTATRGDPFLLPGELVAWTPERLAARLGAGFADAAMRAPVGRWSGPLASSYGLHAVYVRERHPAELPAVAEVRSALVAEWRVEQERKALARALAALRREARIEIEAPRPAAVSTSASPRPTATSPRSTSAWPRPTSSRSTSAWPRPTG